jgi:hypothetical protein
MPATTQPIGQSLFDFLSDGKPNGKNVYEVSSMPESVQELHATIAYPSGQLKVGEGGSDLTAALAGTAVGNQPDPSDAVILGGKTTPAGKPDLVGSAPSTVVTAPETADVAAGLPDLTPSTSETNARIFKSHKG